MSEHSRDAQAIAFHEARPEDLVTDEQLPEMFAKGVLHDSTSAPTLSVEDWEMLDWDHARTGPKGIQEARAALIERVQDPSAPDNDASAYDGLDA